MEGGAEKVEGRFVGAYRLIARSFLAGGWMMDEWLVRWVWVRQQTTGDLKSHGKKRKW